MAKLFQTISLEERLKNSNYNKLPQKPGSVEQGSSTIKYPQDLLKKEGYLLKLTPNAQKENSEILKGYLKSKQIQELPTIKTNFGNRISLEDRLKQRLLGTTQHLPQYFLSDVYTDYIKVKPFEVFNHTSNVEINPFGIFNHTSTIQVDTPIAVTAQGGFTPLPYIFDSLLSQGVTVSNNVYNSFVTILFPGLVNQGPGTNPTPSVLTVNQGPGTDPTSPTTEFNMQFLQGILIDINGNLASVVSTVFTNPNSLIYIPTIDIKQPTSVAEIQFVQGAIKSTAGGELTSFITTTPFTFAPERKSPVLDVLKYAADRALALFTPKIKHGSAFIQTYYASDNVNKHGFVHIPIKYTNNNIKAPEYLNRGVVNYPDPISNIPNLVETFIITALGAEGKEEDLTNIVQSVAEGPNSPAADNTKAKNNPIANYKTLNYKQIVERANSAGVREDFRKTLGITTITSTDNQKTEVVKYDRKSVDVRGVSSDAKDDFVNFKIESKTSSEFVKFRAFITTFSDSFNTTWNDINYVGRQDVIKTFKNVTRASNISFKIAAFNSDDLKEQYKKLTTLVKIASVGKLGSSNKYVTGPVCAITVGRWFKNTPCIFNSVKFDIQMTDYSWDIDQQVPHIIDVAVDMVMLGDLGGKPLNANANNYFDYRG